MRAFLFYIDDWLSSKKIERMDALEERGYLRLLLRAATEPDCGLPDNDAELAIYSKLGQQWYKPSKDKEFRFGGQTSGQKLRHCFFKNGGRLFNERLLKEFLHQQEVQAKRAEAGKKGGRPKANVNQMVPIQQSKQEPNGIANEKQNETNDVCVCVSPNEQIALDKAEAWKADAFDYAAGFHEFWTNYPAKGRVDIEDSNRFYVERVIVDPWRIHEEIMQTIRPGGKWAVSDLWRRGFVKRSTEFLRNRKWIEDPEPYRESPSQQVNGRHSTYESAKKSIEEADLSDVERAY